MSASDWRKLLKQIRKKPAILEKFVKHNKPKNRKYGIASRKCERCGRLGAHIRSYGLHFCRQCFREIAEDLGFKKFN